MYENIVGVGFVLPNGYLYTAEQTSTHAPTHKRWPECVICMSLPSSVCFQRVEIYLDQAGLNLNP